MADSSTDGTFDEALALREQAEEVPAPSPSTPASSTPVAEAEAGAAPSVLRRATDATLDEIGLRLGVHDLSRLEWTVSAPLPNEGKLRYSIELEADLPAAMYVPHNLWDQLQSYTRLQSPSEEGRPGGPELDCDELDELRRDTLGVAHLIKVNRQRFERSAAAAAGHLVSALDPGLPRELTGLIDDTIRLVAGVRHELERAAGRARTALHKEWLLVDEFLSHQLLEFLLRCQRAVNASLLGVSSRLHEVGTDFAQTLLDDVSARLVDEMAHRQARGFVVPRAETSEGIAAYVDRAGQLKRHFEDVLFLENKTHLVDRRLSSLTTLVGAALAGALWVMYETLPVSTHTRAGISLGTATLMFAVAYAIRDRFKEVARQWMSTRLMRIYGQRGVRLTLPVKLDKERSQVVEAQERFDVGESEVDDPLNQHIGATRKIVKLSYRMVAVLSPAPAMQRSGVRRVKHIFRYDLAPLFSRLDSSLRRVPVIDSDGKVGYVEAPREYRIPIRLSVIALPRRQGLRTEARARQVRSTTGELVISRRGIERLEPGRPPSIDKATREG